MQIRYLLHINKKWFFVVSGILLIILFLLQITSYFIVKKVYLQKEKKVKLNKQIDALQKNIQLLDNFRRVAPLFFQLVEKVHFAKSLQHAEKIFQNFQTRFVGVQISDKKVKRNKIEFLVVLNIASNKENAQTLLKKIYNFDNRIYFSLKSLVIQKDKVQLILQGSIFFIGN